MSREYVTIARTSAGAHGRAPPDEPVEVPVEALFDSRGMITGAPDAGVEDATAVLADRLVAVGESVLLVDADGSHRDLASDRSVRLAGDDADCDVRPSRGNAERIATIVEDKDESVVLDCSSFSADAGEVLRSLADTLGRGRRDQGSVVVLLTDCHEWLPDAGDSPCADALHALGRTDTASAVGVVGVTDRPSGVDSRFRRNCDWIAAHRVSWREHVDAVARILGRQYDDALEDLDDGEAFLDGPWTSAVQRVRFEDLETDRRQTDSRLPDRGRDEQDRATGAQHAGDRSEPRTDTADLAAELVALGERIDDLEETVDDRNDVETIAGDLADAVADRLDEREAPTPDATSRNPSPPADAVETDSEPASDRIDDVDEASAGGFGNVFDAFDDAESASAGSSANHDSAASTPRSTTTSATDTTSTSDTTSATDTTPSTSSSEDRTNGSNSGGMSFEPANFAFDEGATGGETSPDGLSSRRSGRRSGERRVPRYVRDLVRTVEEMDPTTRQMLAHYVDRGADTPMNAHFSAGGSDDRTSAYAHNRQLRTTGFVEHVGRGHYAPTIPEKVREEADSGLSTEAVKKATEHVRRALP